jgi:hypothetical protein
LDAEHDYPSSSSAQFRISVSGFKKTAEMTSGNDQIAYFSALIDYIRMKFFTWMQNMATRHRTVLDFGFPFPVSRNLPK